MTVHCVGVLVVPSITEDCNVFGYKERIKEVQSLEMLGTTRINQTTQC
jgi:hypothetical protein